MNKLPQNKLILSATFLLVIGACLLIFNINKKPDLFAQSSALQNQNPKGAIPGKILDLHNWYLTLPEDSSRAGNPDTIMQPQLRTFVRNPYFAVNSSNDGVVFRAPINGETTKHSKFPRSELREMDQDGKTKASWSNKQGVHTLEVKEAVTHLPSVRPKVVTAQIHDEEDDVILVSLEQSRLFVETNGKVLAELDKNYILGTPYTIKIVAADGRIKVYYNDIQRLDYKRSGANWYFKAGCYTQSNLSKGDSKDAYGAVVLYKISATHT